MVGSVGTVVENKGKFVFFGLVSRDDVGTSLGRTAHNHRAMKTQNALSPDRNEFS